MKHTIALLGNETVEQITQAGVRAGHPPLPSQVQLGSNCRAMVYGWKLRSDVELKQVTLESLSEEVVIGLMGVSVCNP